MLLFLSALTGLAALAFLIYLGLFSRYWADDFCYVVTLQNSGNILAAARTIYTSWSNRYSNILLVGITMAFGKQAVSYLPGVMISLLVLALIQMLDQAKRWLKIQLPSLVIFNLAISLAFFSIIQAPNRFQAVYWMMGLVTYFAPLIFLAWLHALLFWGIRTTLPAKVPWLAMIGLGILAFLSGGFSETTLAFQVSLAALEFLFVLGFVRSAHRRNGLILTGTVLAFSLAALLVIFFAPGNAVRLESIPGSGFAPETLPLIFRFAWGFIWDSTRAQPLPTVISVLGGLGLGLAASVSQAKQPASSSAWVALGLVLPLAYLLIASLVAPSVYVYGANGYPEPRALFPARFVLTSALMLAGFLAGWQLGSKITWRYLPGALAISLILLLVAVYPLWFVGKELSIMPQIQRYAQKWDKRDAFLRAEQQQGRLDVMLDGIQSPGGLIELRQSPGFWVNICVADYYNLNSIAVFP